jgi:thiol-disulfide isomerase/thioredoxin
MLKRFASVKNLLVASVIAATLATGSVTFAAAKPAAKAKPSIQQVEQNAETAGYKAMAQIAKALKGASMVDVLESKNLQAKFGPKLIPILGSVVKTFDVSLAQRPELAPYFTGARNHYLAIMAVLGDKAALARLSALAKSSQPFQNLLGRMYMQEYQWLNHQNDAAAQQKVIDTLDAMGKKHPRNEDLFELFMTLRHIGPANHQLAHQAKHIMLKVLKGPAAQQYQQQVAMQTAQTSRLNHHAVFTGVLLGTGKPFSTASLKGHVVLVDSWATWCPPCRASMPHVEKLYAQLHKKGFDVIGMSVNRHPNRLTAFLAAHKKMVWPQMYDVKNPGNVAMATAYGITAIPTQFILDRKGVLRYIVVGFSPAQVTADVKKLLAE